VIAAIVAALESAARAQLPGGDTRLVTLVVPIAAGGGADTIGRCLGNYVRRANEQ